MRRSLLCAALALTACAEPLDTTRVVPERGTLGEEIFGIFHADFAREDPRRADGFLAARGDFVTGFDHLLRPEELRYTQDFLVRLLPLQDDGTLPETTRSVAGALDRLVADEEALRALAGVLARQGYVARPHQDSLLRRIAAYPEYRRLTRALVDLGLGHDGLDADGAPDPDEADELRVLQAILSEELMTLEVSEGAERDIVRVVDLLLTEDPAFAVRDEPVLIVRRDPRGLARVTFEGATPAGPFVDEAPQDGLPDVDVLGRFVSAEGDVLEVPPFDVGVSRDAQGRLRTGDREVFQYVDLDRTLLASLLREGRELVEDDITMPAVRTFDAVLGERVDGRYRADDSPLLDLVYAAGQAGDLAVLPDLIELLQVLLRDHEPTLGWTLVELEDQLDVADRYDVRLEPGHTLQADLLNWIRKLLRAPGLAEDVLETLEDPAVLGLVDATVLLASHKAGRITEGDFDGGRIFSTPVDRARPDEAGNQSLAQRLFHLIHDTKGAAYEPELIGIPVGFIFEIDDLAEFYLLSLIGESEVPGLVSALTGLPRLPGPVDLARFINQDQDFGNPLGNEGLEVKDNDGDTLYAVSASGMADALTPLVRVFHDRGELDLLFELFEILHLHWASPASDYQSDSPASPRYSKLSGIARYEPMLVEQFETTRVLDAVQRVLVETRGVRVDSGRTARSLLLATARHLMAKRTDLVARDGTTSVTVDGDRVTPLSPFDLVQSSLQALDRRIDRRARTRAEWDQVTEALSDQFVSLVRTGPEAGALGHPTAKPTLLLALGYAEDRARAQDDLSAWITTEALADLEDALVSRELPAAFDLVYALDAEPEIDAAMRGLRDELLDEARGFADLLVVVGDGLEAAKDARLSVPLLRFAGAELSPERGHVFRSLDLFRRSLELDPDEHLLEVARRGLEPRGEALPDLYLYGLGRAIRQANRLDPLAEGPLDHRDLAQIFGQARDWMLDQEHGLEKFYGLVRGRRLENR